MGGSYLYGGSRSISEGVGSGNGNGIGSAITLAFTLGAKSEFDKAGLIIYGVIILIIGFMDKEAKGWARGLAIVLGFFLLILGIIFIFYLQTAATFLYFLLAIAFMIGGFARIVYGLSGHYY